MTPVIKKSQQRKWHSTVRCRVEEWHHVQEEENRRPGRGIELQQVVKERIFQAGEGNWMRKHRIDEVGEGKCDCKCVQERTEVSVSRMLKQEKETSVKWISWHISQWERVLDSECTAVHWLIWCAVHLQHYWWVSERARHTGWHTHTISNTMTVGWVDSTPSVWVDNCWRWVGDNDSYIGEGSTSR